MAQRLQELVGLRSLHLGSVGGYASRARVDQHHGQLTPPGEWQHIGCDILATVWDA